MKNINFTIMKNNTIKTIVLAIVFAFVSVFSYAGDFKLIQSDRGTTVELISGAQVDLYTSGQYKIVTKKFINNLEKSIQSIQLALEDTDHSKWKWIKSNGIKLYHKKVGGQKIKIPGQSISGHSLNYTADIDVWYDEILEKSYISIYFSAEYQTNLTSFRGSLRGAPIIDNSSQVNSGSITFDSLDEYKNFIEQIKP